MNSDGIKKLEKQNEIIISLLGRVAFKKDEVREIVTRKKKKEKQEKYVEGYNACDGAHSLSDISKIVGVTPGTLSPILREWEDVGFFSKLRTRKQGRREGASSTGRYSKSTAKPWTQISSKYSMTSLTGRCGFLP